MTAFDDTYVNRLMSLQQVNDETDVQRQRRILSELLDDIRRDIESIFGPRDTLEEERRRNWQLKI